MLYHVNTMPSPNLLVIAEQIARHAHAGQRYGDRDYIEAHVLPVVNTIRRLGYGALHQAVGWLHDVVEDSDWTPDSIREQGIPPVVVRAVERMTKRSGQDHAAYLRDIGEDPYATVAKFADSWCNGGATVHLSPELPDAKFRQWGLEYAGNMAYLLPRLPKPDSPVPA